MITIFVVNVVGTLAVLMVFVFRVAWMGMFVGVPAKTAKNA